MKLNKLLSSVLILLSTSLLASCIDTGASEDISSTQSESKKESDESVYDGPVTELLVSVYAAGYGQDWIDEACRIYEEQHPGVKFKIRANSRMFDTIKTELSNDVCKSDVVIVAHYDYLNLVSSGKLEDLSDVYNSKIPDQDLTIYDATAKEQLQILYTGENKDKIYGIPWQDSYCSGFIYNKKMFRENGWQVPKTMDEFFALCDQMDAKGITPLVYGGGQQDAYCSLIPPVWNIQYYGYDYFQNTFEQYLSPEQYKYTEEGRLKSFQTLARLLKGTLPSGKSIALTGSNAFTAQAAQREFIKGNAAMDICGSWFPTEMKSILKDVPDFECGFINLPHINPDMKDANGNDTEFVNYALQANLFAVPANSANKEIAKDFLRSTYTKESYTSFVKANNGVTRPINVPVDTTVLGDFAKEVYERAGKCKEYNICVYETSTSPMAINGYLGIMNFSGTDYYASIINARSYEEAMSIASTASAADYQTALSFWNNKTNDWDEKFLTQR